MRGHFVHHCLPCSLRHFWIVCREVSTSQIEVKRWLTVRFVHRVQQAFCFASVAGAKGSLLLRAVVLPVENAVTSAIESVFELHVFLHVEENERAEFFPLASTGGVATECVRIVDSPVDLLANLLAFFSRPVLPAGEIARREQFKFWLQR